MKNRKITISLGATICIIGIISILVFDKYFWQTGILTEGRPNYSDHQLLRSVLIFIFVTGIITCAIMSGQPEFEKEIEKWGPMEKISIMATLFLSTIFVVLFLVRPSVFATLCKEDGVIEWASAIFLLGSSVLFFVELVTKNRNEGFPNLYKWIYLFFFFVFFLIAMEEISWFQRIFNLETPGFMNRNMHSELNIHNFLTDPSENIYYFGAFAFLVVLPFSKVIFPILRKNSYLVNFVPKTDVLVIGAVACAYNYDMWNILLTQAALYGSVVIILMLAVFCRKRGLLTISVISIVVTQSLFLGKGENFLRIWDVTEYKELFIPLSFFIYSMGVYRNSKDQYQKKANPACSCRDKLETLGLERRRTI